MGRPVIQSDRTGENTDYKKAFVNVYNHDFHRLRAEADVKTAEGDVVDTRELGKTNELVDLPFTKLISTVSLNSDTAIDDNVITLSPGHGSNVGELLFFEEGERFSYAKILSINVNDITIDSPMDFAYTTNAEVGRYTDNLLVDGSSTPQIFSIRTTNLTDLEFHLKMIKVHIIGTGELADDDFGSISGGLTKGIQLRVKNNISKNVCNFKTNDDFVDKMNVQYEDKPLYSLRGECDLQSFYDVMLKLESNLNDELQIIISDDLTSDIAALHFSIKGHVCIC